MDIPVERITKKTTMQQHDVCTHSYIQNKTKCRR